MAQLGLVNKLEQGWVTSSHRDPRRGLCIKPGGGQGLRGHRDNSVPSQGRKGVRGAAGMLGEGSVWAKGMMVG